ncbi:MAG TPA: GTP 3',8-cyclase MoaA [Methylibium sp.]|nr:GTP 3',8-cyclase MoaA [Methylibium sp.]
MNSTTAAATPRSRVVPILPEVSPLLVVPPIKSQQGVVGAVVDEFTRPLKDLRISVIDQCNFRCSYCMPSSVFGKDYNFLSRNSLLSVAEIGRVASAFVRLGVRKIRLTGGEPLLRKELPDIIESLSSLRGGDAEVVDIAMTTNGSLLDRKALALRQAGLKRVTVSLDALDDDVFRAMNDVGFPVANVLAGIDAAVRAGLGPIKVNMVVKRGINDDQVVPMAKHFRDHYGALVSLRFIEYMDVGHSNDWKMDGVVPSQELARRLHEQFAIEPMNQAEVGETAERWRYLDGRGEVGFISSVTQPFCGDCCRARLSADGKVYTCLFGRAGYDLRDHLRSQLSLTGESGAGDEYLMARIRGIWSIRDDRYSESRSRRPRNDRSDRVEMHYIGG